MLACAWKPHGAWDGGERPSAFSPPFLWEQRQPWEGLRGWWSVRRWSPAWGIGRDSVPAAQQVGGIGEGVIMGFCTRVSKPAVCGAVVALWLLTPRMFLTSALLSCVFPPQGLVNILMERRRAFVSTGAVSPLLHLPSEGRVTAEWWKRTAISLSVSLLSSGVYPGLMGCFYCFRQPLVRRSVPSFWWHLNRSCLGYMSTTATVRRFSETSSECLCGAQRNVCAGSLVKANCCPPSP